MSSASAGYSGTPLVKKLGIRPGFAMCVTGEPMEYWDYLSPLPEGIVIRRRPAKASLDFLHIFLRKKSECLKAITSGKDKILKSGMIWVSWPKKSSGVASDLDENFIRDMALRAGLVDVKVCAIDATWSGLKLVYRLKDR